MLQFESLRLRSTWIEGLFSHRLNCFLHVELLAHRFGCSYFRTTETIATFIQPLLIRREDRCEVSYDWIASLTAKMARCFAKADRRSPRDLEMMALSANSGRIYFEQLHLHPVRLGLTFTQEWMDSNGGSETVMIFQFIRGMVRFILWIAYKCFFVC
jgi:hypothetical protein